VQLRWLTTGDTTDARRGQVVIAIPAYDGYEHFVGCLQSVLEHTPVDVPILVCDDASPDPRLQEHVGQLDAAGGSDHTLYYLRRDTNLGFPANVNGAFAAAAPADVVVLNSDCVVAEGWIEGLRDAAYSDSRVATATALTDHGTLASVPNRGKPGRLPPGWDFQAAADAVRARSARLRPRLPTAIGHCIYVRRSALDLVGDFDLAFSPGYGEEVDFSQRCIRAGMSHVLADEVLVQHHAGGSFNQDSRRGEIQRAHERMLAARYPYYHQWIQDTEDDAGGPLARVLGTARRVLKGLSVVIDGRILTGPTVGSQVQVLEVISALARTGRARISVVMPDRPNPDALRTLRSLDGLRLVSMSEAGAPTAELADVVHRPFQINGYEDLAYLGCLGERLIITQQDLISFHNPGYFRNPEGWRHYRHLTRLSLAVADHVVFVSEHGRRDATSEELVEPHRASVVHNGVDHSVTDGRIGATAPSGSDRLPDGAQVILCLGTDFRHKNRVFALRLLEALRADHGWPGYLAFAGAPVQVGSSRREEAELLAAHPELSGVVIDFRAVSEAEKVWLFERAALVLYPTVHEGFGLVPFEAAHHDRPCMWAAGTSLSEVLPDAEATIVAWDAHESAVRAIELLTDRDAHERNLTAVRAAGENLTWDVAAAGLLEIYERACDAPMAPAAVLERGHGLLNGMLSDDALRLVGPEGAIPRDLQRPLLALATHPQVGTPVFGAIRAGYRLAYQARRRWRRPGAQLRR
jgi:GT2 family glycosyltransferase/glycosyltransferase involved in cell wall biosynthesis